MKYYLAKHNGTEVARDESLMKLRWKVRNYVETYHLGWSSVEIFRVKNDKYYLISKQK